MKTTYMIIAIVAAGLLAGCGGKAAEAAGGADTSRVATDSVATAPEDSQPDADIAFTGDGTLSNGLSWHREVSAQGDVVKLILKDASGNPVQTLSTQCHDWVTTPDYAGEPLLADANFDGKPDILVSLGSYGAQGLLYYACFLWNDTEHRYVEEKSFDEIPNPQVDAARKLVTGEARASAAEVEHSEYRFDGKHFVQVKKWTETLSDDDE